LALDGGFIVLEDNVFIITKEEKGYSSYLVDMNKGFEIKINDYIPEISSLQGCYSSIIFNNDQLVSLGCNGSLIIVEYYRLQKSVF